MDQKFLIYRFFRRRTYFIHVASHVVVVFNELLVRVFILKQFYHKHLFTQLSGCRLM